MLSKVQACQTILDYQFKDQHLCWEALQMAGNGVRRAGPRSIPNGNKRLAIIGDFVLDLVLSEQWYHSGGLEGTWDTIRQTTLSNSSLGVVGMKTNLNDCVQLGHGQSPPSAKVMATTVEAVVGAVYLDGGEGGLAAVRRVMLNLGIAYAGAAV